MRDPDEDPEAARWQANADVCHACAERSSAARAASEQNEGHGMDGWMWSVTKLNGQH
jgi:hypothetical protein